MLRIEADVPEERVDQFLTRHIEELTRSGAQKLIAEGLVTVSGVPVKKNHRTAPGQVIEVSLPAPVPVEIVPQDISLDVVYEDHDVIVVNKKRGMVVHPAPGHPDSTLVNALLHHCRGSLSGINGEIRPGIVHRIDKDTSGLILAAKNDAAHLSLSAQLKDRSLSRIYEAVVFGSFRDTEGTICAPIGRHHSERKRMSVTPTGGREAVTHYTVLARYKSWTHVRCRLETGRTHQIRVHMAHIGHPLLGDLVYGHKKAEEGLSGQCLHAKSLQFIHPKTKERIHLDTELPDYFQAVLKRLGQTLTE